MSHSLKTRAEALLEAANLGYVGVGDVIAWVDNIIEAEESPDPALFDATVAGSDRNKLSAALSQVHGDADPRGVVRLVIGHMRTAWLSDPTLEDRVVKSLFDMAISERFPDDDASDDMYWFYDALDLAKDGTLGGLEEVRAMVRRFLDQYSDTE